MRDCTRRSDRYSHERLWSILPWKTELTISGLCVYIYRIAVGGLCSAGVTDTVIRNRCGAYGPARVPAGGDKTRERCRTYGPECWWTTKKSVRKRETSSVAILQSPLCYIFGFCEWVELLGRWKFNSFFLYMLFPCVLEMSLCLSKKFGQHLCAVRKAKKLTQCELSERCECSEKYLGDIERGKRIPSFTLLTKISFALETPIESFLVDIPIAS